MLCRFLPWLPSLITILLRLLCLDDFIASPFFQPLGGDRGLYDRMALAIAQGHGVCDVYTFLPLYPYLLGGLYFCLGGVNLAAVAILQALLDGVTTWLIFGLAQRRYGRGAAAFLAALGFALLGPAMAYSLVTMPVSLGLFWTAIAATCAERWKDQWTLVTAGAMGLILGVGGQILGAFWLMILPFAAWIAVAKVSRPVSQRFFQALLVIVLGYACLLPSLIHNFRVSREWIPVSAHAGLNLYMGNNPASEGYGTALPGLRISAEEMTGDSVRLASRLAGQPMNLVAANRFWQMQARRFWTHHPARAMRLLARKLQRLVSIRDFDDTGLCRLLPDSVPPLKTGVASFGLVWLLACIGYGARPAARAPGAWIMGFCIAGGMLITFVTARYRLPLAVLLLPAAGGTLAAIPGLFRATRRICWPRLIIGWAGCLVAVIPHGMPDTALADSLNLSAYWQQQGNGKKALLYAQQAVSIQPDSADASFALGNAWLVKNNYTLALAAFQHVLSTQPERTDALFNAGLALEYLGRKAEAQTFYERVIALDNQHAKAWFALALLYRDQGNSEQARQAITAAARLVGWDHPEIVKFQNAQPR